MSCTQSVHPSYAFVLICRDGTSAARMANILLDIIKTIASPFPRRSYFILIFIEDHLILTITLLL